MERAEDLPTDVGRKGRGGRDTNLSRLDSQLIRNEIEA